MTDKNNTNKTSEEELQRLEIRVTELIHTCDQLKEENRLLKAQQQAYSGERAKLLERQEQARTRVEAMINRLKTLEES
jgi:cell division protein ZapB